MKIKLSNFVKLFLAGASLLAVGCTDYGQDIQNLNDRIDKLEAETIDPLKVDFDAVKADLAAAKEDLVGQIAANKELIEGVEDDLAAAVENIGKNTGDITTINENIATLDEAVKGLTSKDVEFAETIEALQLAVANNNAVIEDLKAKNESLEGALNDHKKIYEAYVLTLQTEVNTLKIEVENLKAKDTELAGLIADVDTLAKANQADLATAKKALVTLQAAHTALDGRVGTIETELKEHYVTFADAVKKISALEASQAAQDTKIQAAEAAIETLKTDIGTLKTDVAKAKEDLETVTKELAGHKTAMTNALTEANGKITANADAIKSLVEVELPALQTALEGQIAELKTNLEKLINDNYDALKARIQSLVFVPEHTDGKATIQYAAFNGGATKLDAQSELLYQVHPAECAGAVAAEELTFLFQKLSNTRADVEPELKAVAVDVVDKAKGIVKVTARAYNLNKLYDGTQDYAVSLVFNGKTKVADDQAVESEAHIASAYTTLAVASKPKYDITWELAGTYETAQTIEYTSKEAVELLVGVDVQFYVNGEKQAAADVEAQYGVTVQPIDDLANVTYNQDTYGDGKNTADLFKNEVATPSGYNVSLNLADPADKATVGLVETLSYCFNLVDTISDATLDTLTATGTVEVTPIETKMTLEAQTINWTRAEDNDTDGITAKNPTNRVVTTKAGALLHGEETVLGTTYEDIIKYTPAITVNGADLAAPYNVVFGGTNDAPTVDFSGFAWNENYAIVATYTLPEMTVTLDVTLNTVQETAEVTLAEQTITWNYAEDKNSEPNTASPVPTFRAVATTADNADLYAEVIAGGIAENPVAGFVFTATGVEATGFEWNKENGYELNVTYALENKRVTIKTKINTVKAAFTELVINLEAAQWLLTKDFTNQSETAADSLEAYVAGLTNLGKITAADYLKDVFVTNAYTVDANTANGANLANTMLVVDATAGNTIKSVYNIDDFATAIPEKVDYALNVTTWYGQVIKFTKTLNIGLTPVKVTLAEDTKDIANSLKFTTDAESLASIYDQLTTVDKTSVATADEYLKAIFVDNALRATSEVANGTAYTNTKLATDATAGNTATATYDYTEMTATPDQLTYVSKYTTWYGQEIELTKVVNIDKKIDTYDFEHVPTWVFENPYKSAITPEYTYSNEAARNASAFSLASIVLNDAFLVKNTETKETMDAAALAAVGITLEYSIEDANVPSSLLAINQETGKYEFTYDTKVKSVNISGHLKLATGVEGEVIELPTQFSNGIYADYHIDGYNPLEDHITKTETDAAGNSLTFVELVEAKEYETSVWSLLSIKDKRDFHLFENGAWVAGDDVNGFATGYSPEAIYNAKMTFEIVSIENLPAEQAAKVKVTPETGILTFDYTNKFVAAKPIKVAVKATLEYKYGDTLETTLYYTFQTK